ncbi:type II secretion system protein GspK [Methylosoma difficile]
MLRSNRQTGMALVLVLWILSLMTIMGGSFALSMRREASIVAGEKDNIQAAAVAESGIAIAELMLLDPDSKKRWRTDGSLYEMLYPSADGISEWRVRIRLQSETGKVDLNTADEKVLQALFKTAPIEREDQDKLVGAIIDWRDADDLTHLNGAEQEDYEKAGLPYKPANQPFQTQAELNWVMGMNTDLYRWLEPLTTVHSGLAQVDLQKAAPEMLQTLGNIDPGQMNDYLLARLDSARNDLPAPAFPVKSAKQGGGGKTETISILAEAIWIADRTDPDTDDEPPLGATVNVVVSKANAGTMPFTVLQWQRNATTDTSLFSEAMDDFLVKQYAEPKFNN